MHTFMAAGQDMAWDHLVGGLCSLFKCIDCAAAKSSLATVVQYLVESIDHDLLSSAFGWGEFAELATLMDRKKKKCGRCFKKVV